MTLFDDGDLMDLPGAVGFDALHFNVTDLVFDALLVDQSHARYRREDKERSAEQALNSVTDVMQGVMNLAIGLTWAMYKEAQGR